MHEGKRQRQHSLYDSMNRNENREKVTNSRKLLSINGPDVRQHLRTCSAKGQSRKRSKDESQNKGKHGKEQSTANPSIRQRMKAMKTTVMGH